MFSLYAHKQQIHNARHLIRAYDICSAIRYIFADDVTYDSVFTYMKSTLGSTCSNTTGCYEAQHLKFQCNVNVFTNFFKNAFLFY